MSTNIYSIYKATNLLIPNKHYIGYDSNWFINKNRKYKHEKYSFNKNSGEYYYEFHKAIREFGPENFIWEVIYQSLDGEHCLKIMENHFIKEYNSFYKWENGGYNMTLGGDGILGRYWTEKQLKECSERNSGENNPMFGRKGTLSPTYGKKSWNTNLKLSSPTKETINKQKETWINKNNFLWIFISPENIFYEVLLLKDFCKKFHFFTQDIKKVIERKKQNIHGWKVFKILKTKYYSMENQKDIFLLNEYSHLEKTEV